MIGWILLLLLCIPAALMLGVILSASGIFAGLFPSETPGEQARRAVESQRPKWKLKNPDIEDAIREVCAKKGIRVEDLKGTKNDGSGAGEDGAP